MRLCNAAKILLSGLILMIVPRLGFSGSLLLDARTDYKSYTANDAVAKPSYAAFQMTRIRMDYQNKLGELNSFRARIDLLNAAESTAIRDKTSKLIDFAFLTRKINDHWSFTMGKIISGMGGTEANNNSGDIYLRSLAGDEIAGIYWPTGAQIESIYGENRLRLNVGNNTEDICSDPVTCDNLKQTRNLTGLTYTSKFFNGSLLPNLSFHSEDFISKLGVKKKNTYLAVGFKYLIQDFEIEADRLANDYDLEPQANTNVLATYSNMGLIRYKIKDFGSVHVKYENSERKKATSAATDSKSTVTGTTVAVEYRPIKDENWRLHLAVTQKDEKPEAGSTKKENSIYLGMRIIADVLN